MGQPFYPSSKIRRCESDFESPELPGIAMEFQREPPDSGGPLSSTPSGQCTSTNAAGRASLNPRAREFFPENHSSNSTPTFYCEKCTKPATHESPLKLCSQCKGARYCSRECQAVDWKTHKHACRKKIIIASGGESSILGSESPKKAPDRLSASDWESLSGTDRLPPWDPQSTYRPFWERDTDWEDRETSLTGSLVAKHWVSLSEETALSHIIDAYRLRIEDEYTLSGSTRGIYNQDPALPVFRRFLDKAEKRKGLLPSWWSKAKRRECDKLARRPGAWTEIDCAVEKNDIVEHYGDESIPMFLRLFAEKVELKSAI